MEPKLRKVIVAIAGYAGAGKDTLAKATTWHLAKRGIDKTGTFKFADELKEGVNQSLIALGLEPVAFTEDRAEKDKLRPLLKEMGVYARSKDIDIFAKLTASVIKSRSERYDVFFVSDMRYLNEYRILDATCTESGWGFIPIYVFTHDNGPANEEEYNSIDSLLNGAPQITRRGFNKGDLSDFDSMGGFLADYCQKCQNTF